MSRPTSGWGLGNAVVLVVVLVLGIGVGTVFASAEPRTMARSGPAERVDLTRHSNAIVPGVAGSRGSLDVSCPKGTVIGGGFSAGRNLRIFESRPHGIRTWRVSWMQTSTDDTVAYAYAVCMI